MNEAQFRAQKKKLEQLREKKEMKDNLPFLLNKDRTACNAHKLYTWQRDYILTKNKLALLTAANQVGKSSGLIIKNLWLGYNKSVWPEYFKFTPRMFIYMYPDFSTATTEFEEKWEKVYLPRGKYRHSSQWGWEAKYHKGEIRAVKLASGVTIYFRAYTQDPKLLQAVTVSMITMDEECPQSHFDELAIRAAAVEGMIGSGFTATLGQEYLYKAMEMQGSQQEMFPHAWKRQISLYDCLTYADGSKSSVWTKPKIENDIIPSLSSEAEIKKRVWGKFVKSVGLLYGEFEISRNTADWHQIKNWLWYCGIDFGSGGKTGHPSAICIVAVKPDYLEARVFEHWCSGKEKRVTQGDVLEQWKLMTSNKPDILTYYDWAATDLGELAAREGTPMLKAEKSHEIGVGKLNMLFKNGQLKIYLGGGAGDTNLLVQELQAIDEKTPKNKRVDDNSDALRYALSSCPMRMTMLEDQKKKKKEEISHPRMRFWKGLDKPQEERDWHLTVESQLEEAAAEFDQIL
jgi:hypothetical protein